ncbi:MAG: hypothetical protein ACODAD_09295 [Planctomycetota bacterium]
MTRISAYALVQRKSAATSVEPLNIIAGQSREDAPNMAAALDAPPASNHVRKVGRPVFGQFPFADQAMPTSLGARIRGHEPRQPTRLPRWCIEPWFQVSQ